MGAHTKVSDSLTRVSGATNNNGVLAGRSASGELVKGDDLTAGLENAGTGGLGDLESGDSDLGDLVQTSVVGDSAGNNNNLTLVILGLDGAGDARDGDGGSVDLGEEQRSQHNLVELGVGTAGEESVELDQQLQVDIVGLRGRAVAASNVLLSGAVDTHCYVLA